MQTKKHSMVEVVTNVSVGYVLALASQLIIFPMFGMYISIGENILIGMWFTVIAIVRGYLIRRFFMRRTEKVSSYGK